jgi:hypothetical protein
VLKRGRPRRLALAAAVLAIVLALVFLPVRPRDPALFPVPEGETGVTVYVLDNGYHSEVVVPTARLAARGGPAAQALKSVPSWPWTSLGWGDARYYIESGISGPRILDGLRALFAPNNPSVVMVEPLRASPERLYRRGGVVRLRLSDAGFERLAARVDRSFRLEGGRPVLHPAPGWGDTRFFDSGETFSLLHLCNHWTGETLNAAGVPARPVLDTLAAGLVLDLRISGAAR